MPIGACICIRHPNIKYCLPPVLPETMHSCIASSLVDWLRIVLLLLLLLLALLPRLLLRLLCLLLLLRLVGLGGGLSGLSLLCCNCPHTAAYA